MLIRRVMRLRNVLVVCAALGGSSAGCASCAQSYLGIMPGTINDPANRTLRREILNYGIGQFCTELVKHSAPLKLADDQPAIGRFFPTSCSTKQLPNGDSRGHPRRRRLRVDQPVEEGDLRHDRHRRIRPGLPARREHDVRLLPDQAGDQERLQVAHDREPGREFRERADAHRRQLRQAAPRERAAEGIHRHSAERRQRRLRPRRDRSRQAAAQAVERARLEPHHLREHPQRGAPERARLRRPDFGSRTRGARST